MTETESGAEFISEAHIRHVLRYVHAMEWIPDNLATIWDAACGTGYGTKILSKRVGEISGLDFNKEAIEDANKLKLSNCEFLQIDFMSEHFDVICNNSKTSAIVSIETLEHFNQYDAQKVLKNFRAALFKTGILIITTPYCTYSGPSPITKQHLWEYSLTDFEQALVAAGFEIELMKLDRHIGQAGRLGYAMAKCRKV